ncbi:hypothetical protein ACUTAF_02110 [Pseudomonas sp. SP16.1]|uniref:hypothetical protein n=1 Tax=Pseudomonas sp. SP16.1 TaxID=3458854 RepID=UPI0040463AC7
MAGKSKADKAAEALLAKAIELSGLTADAFAALSEEERGGFTVKAQEAIDAAAVEAKRLAEEAKAAKTQDQADTSHLVKMAKGGDEISVHPSCVADHKRIGWVEA